MLTLPTIPSENHATESYCFLDSNINPNDQSQQCGGQLPQPGCCMFMPFGNH